MMKRIFLVVLGLILVYILLYSFSIKSLEVSDPDFVLTDVSLSGFSLSGSLAVSNNGLVPVGVDHVKYSLSLDEELGNGSVLVDSWVWPGQTENVSVLVDVQWAPAAEVALNLLTPGETYVTITGDIHLIGSVRIPFETKVDVEPFLEQFIKDSVDSLIDSIKGWLA